MAATEQAAPFVDTFAPAAEEQWRQKVETALKGAPLQKLVGKTYDGFDIQPLYARAAGKPRAFRAAGDWAVTARLDHPDAAAANELALDRSRKRRRRPACRFRRFGRRLRLRAQGRRRPRARAQGRPSRRRPARSCSTFPPNPALSSPPGSTSSPARGYDPKKLDISFGLDPIGAAVAQANAARLGDGRSEARGTGRRLSWPRALTRA